MDQGSNKNHSPAYNFAPTVTKFCVMWEGLSLPHDTKFGNCRCKIVDSRSFPSWSLIHGLRWSGLIKVGPGYLCWHHANLSIVSIAKQSSYWSCFSCANHWFEAISDRWFIFLTWWRHQMETFSALLAIVRGIHRSLVNSPHKGQWRGALMFSLICVWSKPE